MIDDTLQYLAVSQNDLLNELLRTHYGDALHICSDLIDVERTVCQRWPQALIVDVESTQATAQWCYTFRQNFPIAEIPLILFQEQSDPTLEQQVSHLNRLSILSGADLDSVTTFVDILIDAYVRDPFYERQAQLLTLERVTQLWLNHNCGQMFYTRFNDEYSPEEGHRVSLVHGGVQTPLVLKSLKRLLQDPRPTIEIEENSQYLGDWLSVGEMLFDEIKLNIRPGFLRIRQWFALIPNPELGAIAKDLPIAIQTRRLLQQDHTWQGKSLHDRIAALELRNTQVEIDIEILVRLGLYQLTSTSLQQDGHTNTLDDLPNIPPEQWTRFLERALTEQLHRFAMINPWTAWNWTPNRSLKEQRLQIESNWTVFDTLSSIDARDTLCQLHDEMNALVNRLTQWQHCYSILGSPPEEEDTAFWTAIRHLEQLDPNAAREALTNCTHPLPRGLYLWLEGRHVLTTPSRIRPIVAEMSSIVEQGHLPRFEVYMAVLQMAMGHWSQASKRLQTLPSSLQIRSLLWDCQRKTLNRRDDNWVFWQI